MQNPVLSPTVRLRKEPDASSVDPQFARKNRTVRDGAVEEVPPVGAELSHESAGKSQVAEQGDAESDAVCVVSDPRLARLIEVWPALADDVKGEMLTLAGLRPYDVDDVNDVTTATHGEGAA